MPISAIWYSLGWEKEKNVASMLKQRYHDVVTTSRINVEK